MKYVKNDGLSPEISARFPRFFFSFSRVFSTFQLKFDERSDTCVLYCHIQTRRQRNLTSICASDLLHGI